VHAIFKGSSRHSQYFIYLSAQAEVIVVVHRKQVIITIQTTIVNSQFLGSDM